MRQIFLFLSFLFLSFPAISQDEHSLCAPIEKPPLTEEQVAYAVDAFGNEYTYQELLIPNSNNSNSFSNMSDGYSGCNCSDLEVNTEYFNLWFEDCDPQNSTNIAFNDPIDGENRRRVACEVFAELAEAFPLQSNTSCNSLEQVVNIRISHQGIFPPDVLGLGGGFYKNNGIKDNKAYLVINGIETSNSVSHGNIRINFTDYTNWYYGTAGETLSGNFDLRSVFLHEALHVLGFHSNIHKDGGEPSNFHRYDDHIYMKDSNGQTKLLAVTAPSFDYSFDSELNTPEDLFKSCQDDQGVYGPDMIFKTSSGLELSLFASIQGDKSSFSHFEYDCDGIPNGNYAMLKNIGTGVQRSFTDEEKEVFATMGYIVNGTTGSPCEVTGVYDYSPSCGDSYSVSACSTLEIHVNDLLYNDLNATDIASIRVVNSFIGGSISSSGPLESGESFIFTPAGNLGTAYLEYIPESCDGELGNITRVQISVTYDAECGPECRSPLSCAEGPEELFCTESFCNPIEDNCNLICNSDFCGSIFSEFVEEQSRRLNGFDEGNFVDLPIWSGAGFSQTYFITPSFGEGGSVRLRGGTLDWSDGVFTPLELIEGQKYFFSIWYEEDYGGTNDPEEDNLINISRINLELLNTSPPCSLVPCYNGISQNILDIDFILDDPEGFRRTGTNFIADNISSDGLFLSCREGTTGGEPKEGMYLDNIEVVPDYFTAGEDKETLYCDESVIVGAKFCMLSDVEVLYEWVFNEEVLASYSVSNGVVSNVSGEVNMNTHETTLYPTETGIYTLRRTIQDYGGLEETTFDNCIMEDDIFIDVHQEVANANFTYVHDCGEVSFESYELTGSHSWDFDGDGIEDSNEGNPVINLPEGTYTVTHTIYNFCGEDIVTLPPIIVEECFEPLCEVGDAKIILGNMTFGEAIDNDLLEPLETTDFTYQNIYIDGQLTLETSLEEYRFSTLSTITMAPGASIVVQDGSELGITGGTVVSGCVSMWEGIRVQSGGALSIGDNGTGTNPISEVNDAEFAIIAENNSLVSVVNSRFTNNHITLDINLSGEASPNVNLTILGNTFNGIQSQMLAPTNTNITNPSVTNKPYTGIRVNNIGAMNIGTQGGVNGNTFSIMRNGIIAQRTDIFSFGNTFNAIQGLPSNSSTIPEGVAIYGSGNHRVLEHKGNLDNDFNICKTGIKLYGMGLNITDTEMNNMTNGILMKGNTGDIFIRDNEITAQEIGVQLGYNVQTDLLSVEGNIIDITGPFFGSSTGKAISVSELSTNTTPYNNASIIDNTISLFSENTGISISNLSNIEVSDNTIDMENSTENYAGILIDGCRKFLIDRNIITGSGINNANDADNIGLYVISSGECEYFCNTFEDLNTGALFSMMCINTQIATTTFEDCKVGLHLNSTAFFTSPSNSTNNVQDHNGNMWNGNFMTAALNEMQVDNHEYSQFIVRDNNTNTYPSSILPLNDPYNNASWFVKQGTANLECLDEMVQAEVDISYLDLMIAKDSLFFDIFEDGRKYLSEQYLYRKLLANPQFLGEDTDIDAFYAIMSASVRGELETLDDAKKLLHQLDSSTKSELTDNKVLIKNFMSQIRTLESELSSNPSDAELLEYRSEKEVLLQLMKDVNDSQKELVAAVEAVRNSEAEWIKSDNGLIYTSKLIEANEKSVNDVFLGGAAKGIYELSPEQISELTYIALQCPVEGGDAVFAARSLLEFHGILDIYRDEDLCNAAGIQLNVTPDTGSEIVNTNISLGIEESETINTSNTNTSSTPFDLEYVIYPNPATNDLTLICPQTSFNQHFMVYDIYGRKLLEQQVEGKTQVSLKDWSSGVYFVKVTDKNRHEIWSDKLIIIQ